MMRQQPFSWPPTSFNSVLVCFNRYVDEANHWVQMDAPEAVNSYIREFLAARPWVKFWKQIKDTFSK